MANDSFKAPTTGNTINSWAITGTYQINPALCIGCSICEMYCPYGTDVCHEDAMNPGAWTIEQASCIGCGVCASQCPITDAIYPIPRA